jgi:hypothetical protein
MVSLLFLAVENYINEHMYIKNINDNPNCLCGEIESTYHYLVKCPKYTRQRNSLFQNLFIIIYRYIIMINSRSKSFISGGREFHNFKVYGRK